MITIKYESVCDLFLLRDDGTEKVKAVSEAQLQPVINKSKHFAEAVRLAKESPLTVVEQDCRNQKLLALVS